MSENLAFKERPSLGHGFVVCGFVVYKLIIRLHSESLEFKWSNDGLMNSSSFSRQVEVIKKKICEFFKENKKILQYLNIELNLVINTNYNLTQQQGLPHRCSFSHILKEFPVTRRHFLSQEDISCHKKTFIVTRRNFMS